MSSKRFVALSKKRLEIAAAGGVHPPVFAALHPDSFEAADMFTDMYAEPLRPGQGDYDEHYGRFVTCSVANTAFMLRRHGGLGGRLVANLLEEPPVKPDIWWLQVAQRAISLTRFSRGQIPVQSYTLFYRLPCLVCPECDHEQGPVEVRVPVRGEQEVVVRGRTGGRAGRASALARISANRTVPSVVPDGASGLSDLPVKDDELAIILRDFYSDAPDVVAEALGGLKRAGHRGHLWLAKILRTRPELRRLRAGVKRLVG